jgi:hypothetical protein
MPCVWYRARVSTHDNERVPIEDEERAVHFRISDGSGSIRVVPDGARWEIEPSYDASTSMLGEEPPDLRRRSGAATVAPVPDDPAAMSEWQRQAAIDALLTVRQPEPAPDIDVGRGLFGTGSRGNGRRYRESRLEPGETVTIVGQALPWSDVQANMQAAITNRSLDRDMLDDIEQARASGSLVGSPEEAWGNAAIPGFGIGQPTRSPELDPRVVAPEVPDAAVHKEALQRHVIPPGELVLGRGESGTFAIYKGAPVVAAQHHDAAFILGLVGVAMAAFSALTLGLMLSMSA